MKKILLGILLASSFSLAADVKAKEPEKEKAPQKSFKSHGELGYIQTTGNTETKAFNLELNLKKEWKKHALSFDFDGQYATDQNVETKNKYTTEVEYEYKYTDKLSFDYLLGYKSDKFSGFEYQSYTGPGAKYKVLDKKDHNLTIEGNALYSVDQYEDVWADVSGTQLYYPYEGVVKDHVLTAAYKDDYASYRLKGVYKIQLLETLKFQQDLSFRGSFEQSDRYFIYSKTALKNKINSIFSAGLSYKIDYINLPADGKKKTDNTLAVNLILDY